MYKVDGTYIRMTRGDTVDIQIGMTRNGEPYVPQEGDSIRFALKERYSDTEPLILKNIPIDTMLLHLSPGDTKLLKVKQYVYDIQITFANGDVDTFIAEAMLEIAPEVD